MRDLEAEPENQFVPQVGVIKHVNLHFLYILINNGGQSTEPSTVSGDQKKDFQSFIQERSFSDALCDI